MRIDVSEESPDIPFPLARRSKVQRRRNSCRRLDPKALASGPSGHRRAIQIGAGRRQRPTWGRWRSTGTASMEQVPLESVSVYPGSAMGQLDQEGSGGPLRSPLPRPATHVAQEPLGLAEQPTTFRHAYVPGRVGNGHNMVGLAPGSLEQPGGMGMFDIESAAASCACRWCGSTIAPT